MRLLISFFLVAVLLGSQALSNTCLGGCEDGSQAVNSQIANHECCDGNSFSPEESKTHDCDSEGCFKGVGWDHIFQLSQVKRGKTH